MIRMDRQDKQQKRKELYGWTLKKSRILFLFLWVGLLAGCVSEDLKEQPINPPTDKGLLVQFQVQLPVMQLQSRAQVDDVNAIHNLQVLVFTEEGLFLEKKEATYTGPAVVDGGNIGGTFTVELTPSLGEGRILHFVANYDWSDFVVEDNLYKDAGEIIPLWYGEQLYFWARLSLSDGIHKNMFQGVTVELLRNVARAKVVNQSHDLTEVDFKWVATPDLGTVAPFDSRKASFEPLQTVGNEVHYAITEPACDLSYTKEDINYLPLSSYSYSFERRALSDPANYSYILIRGKYRGDTAYSYYKIALIDEESNTLDIERNYEYRLIIKEVLKRGYRTEQEAREGAASNNITLDPLLEKYPAISDGKGLLEVEKNLFVFTEPGDVLLTYANYYKDGVQQNEQISLTLDPRSWALVFKEIPTLSPTGEIRGVLNELPTGQSEAVTQLIVRAGDLHRVIRVILRRPYQFTPITINGANPATLVQRQGTEAILRFSIPATFNEELFPLPIKIYTEGLTADQQGVMLSVDEEGKVFYTYTAENKGVQVVRFKLNNSQAGEFVHLRAPWFSEGVISYNTTSYRGRIWYNYLKDSGEYERRPVLMSFLPYVSFSLGTFDIPQDGVYNYAPPLGGSISDRVEVSYRETKTEFLDVIYKTEAGITVEHLKAGSDLLLNPKFVDVSGRALFGGYGNIPEHSMIKQGEKIEVQSYYTNLEDMRIVKDGVFRSILPYGTESYQEELTLVYPYSPGWGFTEFYELTKLRNELPGATLDFTNKRVRVETMGDLKYRSGRNEYDVPLNGYVTASVANTGGSAEIRMLRNGYYSLTLYGEIRETDRITIVYNRIPIVYNRYSTTTTLAELRRNRALLLMRE